MLKKFPSVLIVTLACAILPALAQQQSSSRNDSGLVFVMTNSADKNEIVVYSRSRDGNLERVGRVATGGRGSGGTIDPLQSQGSLLLSQDRAFLFAVNAGSGTISVFRVRRAGLELIDTEACGGSSPVAVAEHAGLLYVLNDGGNDNLVGFRVDWRGKLWRIPGSSRLLSNNDTGAASLSFSPNGQFLAVTERLNNQIDVFAIQPNGTLSSLVSTPSNGQGAFSSQFAPSGALLVTEAGSASISSYAVQANGTLTTISGALPSLGAATCWHEITPDGSFVYTSNAGTSNISGFKIESNGRLTPLPGTVVGTNPGGSTNLDIAITRDGRFLYTLDAGTGTISVFAIQADGNLTSVGSVGGLPASAGLNGIAAL